MVFTGGSGIGAVGNPIFGRDGALLAVNLVRGGFGYRTPPNVKLRDGTWAGIRCGDEISHWRTRRD